MERLTKWNEKTEQAELIQFNEENLSIAINKLATYEDKREQGLLIELPCSRGSTVYRIDGVKYYNGWNNPCYDKAYIRNAIFRLDMLSSIDKTIFLTKEKAKLVLEKLKNKNS